MDRPLDGLRAIEQSLSALRERLDQLHPARVLGDMAGVSPFAEALQRQMALQDEAAVDEATVESLGAGTAQWRGLIGKHAAQCGVDPTLVEAVMRVESGGAPHSLSPAGAAGLMQLMPATARSLGVRDPFDPDESIQGGTRYLRQMLDRFGDLPRALAAYNAGPAAVEQYGGVPPYPETQAYVRRVLDEARRLEPGG
ncbi:MAG TPA: lytic transglycosylase domain-containing protein [Armatimonadota bacterium]|nr:lytic transglycosylase domain-containing protein [Armatimonadota bacterium]HQK93687.1 lytic transglycosylase domain-containing protein [Armatimonadota bacterium]